MATFIIIVPSKMNPVSAPAMEVTTADRVGHVPGTPTTVRTSAIALPFLLQIMPRQLLRDRQALLPCVLHGR
jgi:hypothetical protein